MKDKTWKGKHYTHFTNRECECFPCHTIKDRDSFNCLFCYCPLYALGEACGGNFSYENDIKDCSNCIISHHKDSFGYITDKFDQIKRLISRQTLKDRIKDDKKTNQDLTIYHVSNSGLLINIKEVKLLIDGIFSDYNPFNPMDSELENLMLNSIDPFSDVDLLLFTHCHKDHYDRAKVEKYLKVNRSTSIAAPKDAGVDLGNMVPDDSNNGQVFVVISEGGEFFKKGVRVIFLKTKHLSSNEEDELGEHYSFIIKSGEVNIFISGDMELDEETTLKIKEHGTFNMAFFNPAVFAKDKWLENFKTIDSVDKYIYHLPLEINDHFSYRKVTISALNKLGDQIGNCYLLLDEMQRIEYKAE